MCYQVPQDTIIMHCTCTEVIVTSKHIINFLTNFMTPEPLQKATFGDLTIRGDGSPKTTHCEDSAHRQRLRVKAHPRFSTLHSTLRPITCQRDQFTDLKITDI